MARPRARKAPTPVTATTLKVRPRGPAPKGMRWDAVDGCWVSARGGCYKRQAAVEASGDENAAPQRRRLRGVGVHGGQPGMTGPVKYRITWAVSEISVGESTRFYDAYA